MKSRPNSYGDPKPSSLSSARPLNGIASVLLNGGRTMRARQVRLANTGANMIVPERVRENQTFSLHLQGFVDGVAQQVLTMAKVVSCSLAGMEGFRLVVRFTELDPDSTAALQRWTRG